MNEDEYGLYYWKRYPNLWINWQCCPWWKFLIDREDEDVTVISWLGLHYARYKGMVK